MRWQIKAVFCVWVLCGIGCHRGTPAPVRVPVLGEGYDTSTIDTDSLGDDVDAARHVLDMSWREVAGRLGSLKFVDKAVLAVTDDHNAVLSEQIQATELTRDSTGNVHLIRQVPPHALELMVREDKCFIRQDRGVLRRKSPRDMDSEDMLESAFAGLAGILRQFKHVTLVKARQEVVFGRETTRYTLSLADESLGRRHVSAPRLPVTAPPLWRLEAREQQLSGSVSVDHETGVVLAASIVGQSALGDSDGAKRLKLRYSSHIEHIGRIPAIGEPSDTSAEHLRPVRPRDPMAFFRKVKGSATRSTTGRVTAEDGDASLEADPDVLERGEEIEP